MANLNHVLNHIFNSIKMFFLEIQKHHFYICGSNFKNIDKV